MSKYDILVEVEFNSENDMEERYIFEDQSRKTVNVVLDSMEKDRVFGIRDKEARLILIKPREVTKLQINIQ